METSISVAKTETSRDNRAHPQETVSHSSPSLIHPNNLGIKPGLQLLSLIDSVILLTILFWLISRVDFSFLA